MSYDKINFTIDGIELDRSNSYQFETKSRKDRYIMNECFEDNVNRIRCNILSY